MAKRPKKEVAALNVRILQEDKRDYVRLVSAILERKAGVRVYGDAYVAITSFNEKSGFGIISKYSEIDLEGDWLNSENFLPAEPEQLDEISIPKHLKPNLNQFYFWLVPDEHLVIFETYAESKRLSSRMMEKFIDGISKWPSIRKEFGLIKGDVVKSYGQVEKILSLPNIRELNFYIRQPNPDDLDEDLAKEIEERIAKQNGEAYEESLYAKHGDGIRPDERSKKLGSIAAENGELSARYSDNGVMTKITTEDTPLVEFETYHPDTAEGTVFTRLANRILETVRNNRERMDD